MKKSRGGLSLLFTFFLVLGFDFWLPLNAKAQVFGEAARTEFFGGFGVRLFYGRINKTDLLINGDEISDLNAPKVFVKIPVLQDLNGSQLGTDFNLRTGLRWIISP